MSAKGSDGRNSEKKEDVRHGRKLELQDFPGDPKVLYIRDEKTKAKIGVKIKGIFPELLNQSSFSNVQKDKGNTK